MSGTSRRTAQLLPSLAAQLLQMRSMAKASSAKLPVVLLQDVEGVGAAGQAAKVNHGFARNFLVPNQQAALVPRQRRRQRGGGTRAAAALVTGAAEAAAAPTAAPAVASHSEGDAWAAAQREAAAAVEKLSRTPLVIKRKTTGGQTLEKPVSAEDLAGAVARQMRVAIVPDLVDLGGEKLSVVGEYLVPLKLLLPDGQRVMLDVAVQST